MKKKIENKCVIDFLGLNFRTQLMLNWLHETSKIQQTWKILMQIYNLYFMKLFVLNAWSEQEKYNKL